MTLRVESSWEVFLVTNQVHTLLNNNFFGRRIAWINIVEGVMSGDILHYRTTTNYELGVNGAENITRVLANGSPLQVP